MSDDLHDGIAKHIGLLTPLDPRTKALIQALLQMEMEFNVQSLLQCWLLQGCMDCRLGEGECLFGLRSQNLAIQCFLVGVYPHCQMIRALLEFEATSDDLPTREQLEQVVRSFMEFDRDPDDYCKENRVKLGCPIVEDLKPMKADEEDVCPMCQEPIKVGDLVYTMPCCQVGFHHSLACLDAKNILDWLKQSKKCPACNCEVTVGTTKKRPLGNAGEADSKFARN